MTVSPQGSKMLIILIFMINIAYFQVKSKISASYLKNYGFYVILRKMYISASENRAFFTGRTFFSKDIVKSSKIVQLKPPRYQTAGFLGQGTQKWHQIWAMSKLCWWKFKILIIFFWKILPLDGVLNFFRKNGVATVLWQWLFVFWKANKKCYKMLKDQERLIIPSIFSNILKMTDNYKKTRFFAIIFRLIHTKKLFEKQKL